MARYSKEFKAEALKLSDELGVKKAAAQFGLPYYTLADWRNNRKHAEPEPELSEVELKIRNRELERENAELRVANEILKLLQGVILHSNRGSQYTSEAFREELRTLGMIQSLSGTGHCFDNARMESFFATLKKEKIYQIATYKLTKAQVKTIVFRYIFTYYNRIRVCSVNPGGLPPVKYREWVAAHAA